MDDEICDIIPATPQKCNLKKLTRKRKKHVPNRVLHKELEYIVIRNDLKSKIPHQNLSFDKYKCPYVFYNIRDICNFSENYQPINPNIKTVGKYIRNGTSHILLERPCSFMKVAPLCLIVNMNLLSTIPKENNIIEMYGFIAFSTLQNSFFVGKFWKNLKTDIDKHMKILQIQKQHIPNCYKEIAKFELNSLLQTTHCSTSYFEEVDESCLNNNVEYLEKIYQEIEQLMSISIE